MKRALGSDSWMLFSARQTIASGTCDFAWRARFGPIGLIFVCDALEDGVARLDVMALRVIPIARTPPTPALAHGELRRYLAELTWAPTPFSPIHRFAGVSMARTSWWSVLGLAKALSKSSSP